MGTAINYAPGRGRRRTGTILAVSLVMVMIVLLLGAVLARAMVLYQQQSERSEQRQQAAWLAESGLQRGLLAAAGSNDYVGETWSVPADVLGSGFAGLVIIRVEKPGAAESRRRVLVEATYPAGTTRRFVVQSEAPAPPPPKPAS